MPNELAPPGSVWVCGACGKRSRDRHGRDPIDRGWDESCAIHAVLCREDSIVLGERGLVEAAEAFESADGPDPSLDSAVIVATLNGSDETGEG